MSPSQRHFPSHLPPYTPACTPGSGSHSLGRNRITYVAQHQQHWIYMWPDTRYLYVRKMFASVILIQPQWFIYLFIYFTFRHSGKIPIDSWSLFVNKVTHVVWSPRQPGSLAARSCPNSLRVKANISCKKSADTVRVLALDRESSDSKRGTCPGNSDRSQGSFFLELACSQLRSLRRRWQPHPPPSPVVPCVRPFAALLSWSARILCVCNMHPHRWAEQSQESLSRKEHFLTPAFSSPHWASSS